MLIFENKGIINPMAITTFGVSAKGIDNAIGYFGTGLKYAIAIILREGGEITIRSGESLYTFTFEEHTIRDKEFQIITMDMDGTPQQLGFTTELGKNWELWQAFRELYCNCIDELGEAKFTTESDLDEIEFETGSTQVIVKGMDKIWQERHEIVLCSEAVYTCNETKIEIHAGKNNGIYFKGIKVYDLPQEANHTYNFFGNVRLTEDRTIADIYTAHGEIRELLTRCTREELIVPVLLPGSYEAEMDFDYCHHKPSAEFETAVAKAKEIAPAEYNMTATSYLLKFVPKREFFPTIELDEADQRRFETAKQFLKDMGITIDDYPITIHEELGKEGIMGRADSINGKILVTRLAFTMGTKQLTSTLLEEWVHLKYRHADGTLAMQSFLFDSWLAMSERHIGREI